LRYKSEHSDWQAVLNEYKNNATSHREQIFWEFLEGIEEENEGLKEIKEEDRLDY